MKISSTFIEMVILVALLCIATLYAKQSSDNLDNYLDNSDLSDTNSVLTLFNNWQAQHKVTFKTEEERDKALDVLMENAKKIKQHRDEYKRGEHSYTLQLNKFSHMTFEEFKSKRLGFSKYTRNANVYSPPQAQAVRRRRATLPTSLNYTAMGYVTPVKNQGNCGCCWTFATTGALEGAYFKKTGSLKSFSEQQLVDCTPVYKGCDGGIASDGVAYINLKGGIATEASYPYASMDALFGTCQDGSKTLVSMKPVPADVPMDDTSLINALVSNGPLAVAVAVGDNFMSYMSGVMDSSTACLQPINHAVLLVGYGKDQATGRSYWLLKNSWDTDWGEKGYFRLNRDVQDSCGINEEVITVTM